MWLLAIIALIAISDANDKLDKHPIPPSAYLALAVGGICLVGVIAAWIIGRTFDD